MTGFSSRGRKDWEGKKKYYDDQYAFTEILNETLQKEVLSVTELLKVILERRISTEEEILTHCGGPDKTNLRKVLSGEVTAPGARRRLSVKPRGTPVGPVKAPARDGPDVGIQLGGLTGATAQPLAHAKPRGELADNRVTTGGGTNQDNIVPANTRKRNLVDLLLDNRDLTRRRRSAPETTHKTYKNDIQEISVMRQKQPEEESENLRQELEAAKRIIKLKDNQIADKDREIGDKTNQLQEKTRLINEKDSKIEEMRVEMVRCEKEIDDKDKLLEMVRKELEETRDVEEITKENTFLRFVLSGPPQ